MLEKQEKGRNSQFLYGCNTDWNLNHEFICWLNHWFKEYKDKAEVKLDYHKFDYAGKEMTQLEIIDRIIELTDKVHKDYYEFDEYRQLEKDVNEIFDLFRLVYWAMWW